MRSAGFVVLLRTSRTRGSLFDLAPRGLALFESSSCLVSAHSWAESQKRKQGASLWPFRDTRMGVPHGKPHPRFIQWAILNRLQVRSCLWWCTCIIGDRDRRIVVLTGRGTLWLSPQWRLPTWWNWRWSLGQASAAYMRYHGL